MAQGRLAHDFVVDVEHDGVAPLFKAQDGLGQEVAAHGLRHVFGQEPAVDVGELPLPRDAVDRHVVDLILRRPPGRGLGLEPGVGVAQRPAGGQAAPQEVAPAFERHLPPGRSGGEGLARAQDGGHGGLLQVIPILDDSRVGLAPGLLDLFSPFVGNLDAVAPSHGLERAHASLVPQGQDGHLADLPLVLGHVGHGLAVDARRRVLVDFSVPPEDFQDALLAGQPGQAPGLDGREVGGDEVMPRLGSDHPPQAVGHDGHGRAVAQGDHRGGVGLGQEPEHAFDGVLLQLGTGHVVRLNLPPGPAAGGGAVVLHGEAHPAVLGRRGEHRLELGRAGLGRLLARLQGLPDGLRRVVRAKESGHVGLGHASRDDALGAHPRRQGGVLVPGGHGPAGHGLDRLVQPGLLLLHHPEGGLDRLPVDGDAPGVNPIIHRPEPALVRCELKELVQKRPLHHHVLPAVFVEAAPAGLVIPPHRRSVRLNAPRPAHLKHEPMARQVFFVGQA